MLIQFGANFVSPFAPPFMRVRFDADRSDGISNGSAVLYRGVNVGRVESVRRSDDGLRVNIFAMVDREPPLPGNVRAVIRTQSAVSGGGAIVLELTHPQPQGSMAENQTVPATYVGLDIIPTEFTDLVNELYAAARQFRESNIIKHTDEQIVKIGRLADSVQTIVDDPQLRSDLKSAIANLRSTTEKADRIAAGFEKFSTELPKFSANANEAILKTQEQIVALSKQVGDRLQQVSVVLDSMSSIAAKVDKGEGTAGLLVNDPKLYQSLVDSTQQLNSAISDLRRLVDQWEKEGVSLRAR
jgi:phospholipid/cholesterol/gamma-HCH transport system substrate-binding protein